jgi:YidC/Oxa1 family membrane protein insertase
MARLSEGGLVLNDWLAAILGAAQATIPYRGGSGRITRERFNQMPRDRTTWIVVSLAVIGLFLSIYWGQQDTARTQAERQAQLALAKEQPSATPSAIPSATPNLTEVSPPSPSVPEKSGALKSPIAEYQFSNLRGGLDHVILLKHKGDDGTPVRLNSDDAPAIGALTQDPNNWSDNGYELSIDEAAGMAKLTRQLANQLKITKVYTVGKAAGLPDEHQLKLTVSFENAGPAEFKTPGFFFSTGSAQPIHSSDRSLYTRFDWYTDGKYRQIDVNWFDPSSLLFFIQTSGPKESYSEAADHILWAAAADQYFATILQSPDRAGSRVWATRHAINNPNGQPVTKAIFGAMGVPAFTLEPGESKSFDFAIYAGPKEYGRLTRLPGDLSAVMDFGWFAPISQVLLTTMNTLHSFVGSYALAIIVMTLIIRLLLWPLQNYSTKSMRRMAKLSPVMNELKAKYKDDAQRMNQEMMKLYKEYKINPFTGCLPMLIQIPIFFGFYSMLGTAVELRGSSFLWVTDLSQPDTVVRLLGFPINILPLIMAATQLWQLRITPKTGDASQQRILMIMPVVFLALCYNFAAALSLYYTVQNLFLIVQTYLTRNQTDTPLAKPAPTPAVAKKKSYR